MSFQLNDWTLSNTQYVTPKIGEEGGTDVYADLDETYAGPFSIASHLTRSPEAGNQIIVKTKLDFDMILGAYVTILVDDGLYKQGIKVYNGYYTLLNSETQVSIADHTAVHEYDLTLKDGLFTLKIDGVTKLLRSDDVLPADVASDDSINPRMEFRCDTHPVKEYLESMESDESEEGEYILHQVTATPESVRYITGNGPVITFDVRDLSVTPYTNLIQDASSTDNGNTVEIVADLSEVDSGTYLAMYIDDATYRQGIKIYNGKVTLLDGSSQTTIVNNAGEYHRYTITMQNGLFEFFFDKKKIYSTTTTSSAVSGESRLFIGFPEEQSGSFVVKFQYIKYAHLVYHYLVLEDVDFTLQIDSAPSFDTVNLKTYSKDDFLREPTLVDGEPVYKKWDPVSYVCGFYTGTENHRAHYDGHGIVTAVTIKMPPKADMQDPMMFYRVRFKGKYESTFTSTYTDDISAAVSTLTEYGIDYTTDYAVFTDLPDYTCIYDLSEQISGSTNIDYSDSPGGTHRIIAKTDNVSVTLPESPSDDYKITFINEGDYPITSVLPDGHTLQDIDPHYVVSFQYDTAKEKWYCYIEQRPAKHQLRPDMTSEIFKAVYSTHLPADMDDVYTKGYDTGVAATIIRSKSREISDIINMFQDESDRTGSFTAPNELFTQRWSNIFGLKSSLFKNAAEMRDGFQCMIANLHGQMMMDNMKSLIRDLTGCEPIITEYKDKLFNVVFASTEKDSVGNAYKYYLYDPDHPSYQISPFTLCGGNEKAYTFQIDIFDPYDLQYNRDMIALVVNKFKPAWTRAAIVFYDAEGYPYTKKYYYGIDSYGQAAYNN